MGKDFFKYLPSELIIDILSRPPIRTTIICKCVGKSWYSLIESSGFVESYESVPCLAVFGEDETVSKPFKVYEVEDELNVDYSKNSCNLVFKFDFPLPVSMHSSTNGLLLLFHQKLKPRSMFVCNPVTREYISLPTARVCRSELQFHLDTYGFGVSKTSGEYKIVRIFYEGYKTGGGSGYWILRNASHYCQVYTLGTGSWRSVAPTTRLVYGHRTVGAFVNGSLHWLASDLKGSSLRISCFDLEAELLTTFSPPPHLDACGCVDKYLMRLSSLRDCLGLCDNLSTHETVIWLMNSYKDEKSWTKQFVIVKPPIGINGLTWPIKVFQDGDILITRVGYTRILCYSNKTKTIQETDMIGWMGYRYFTIAACYTPRFHLLRSFPMENVSSF